MFPFVIYVLNEKFKKDFCKKTDLKIFARRTANSSPGIFDSAIIRCARIVRCCLEICSLAAAADFGG